MREERNEQKEPAPVCAELLQSLAREEHDAEAKQIAQPAGPCVHHNLFRLPMHTHLSLGLEGFCMLDVDTCAWSLNQKRIIVFLQWQC